MPGVCLIIAPCCTNAGTCVQWTVPSGVCQVTFEIWGGGGGGGVPGTNCNCCQRGGPGGGGGYSKKTLAVTPGAQYTICAGAAGMSPTSGYGAVCSRCCNGCAGGTSYVTGTGLSNFCATGGCGGYSDFNTTCYSYCGCNFPNFGIGCGGDIMSSGSGGAHQFYSASSSYDTINVGGNAGGPGGGTGGTNIHGGYPDNSYDASISGDRMHGSVPGGGGAGGGYYAVCTCCPYFSGRGAPGAVKITY